MFSAHSFALQAGAAQQAHHEALNRVQVEEGRTKATQEEVRLMLCWECLMLRWERLRWERLMLRWEALHVWC